MRKIKLELEALEVESFATEVPGAHRGTVNANAKVPPTADSCESNTEGVCETQGCGTDVLDCDPTVHYSCYQSCYLYDTCAIETACTLCNGGYPPPCAA